MMDVRYLSDSEKFSAKLVKMISLPVVMSFALLSACGSQDAGEGAAGQRASQSTVKVAKAMEDDPCALLPRQRVADQFAIPVEAVKQIAVSTNCQYDWRDKSAGLRAEVSVNISRITDDAATAASYFDSATRSMSGQEVSDAMDKVSAEARKRGLDNAQTASVAGAVGGKGIQFEDMEGLGDKARFQPATGAVHVLLGNLYYEIAAYHGPDMPMPETVDAQSIKAASAQWLRDTMPQRKEAAEQLARVVIASL